MTSTLSRETLKKWKSMRRDQKLLNIASEITRMKSWQDRNDQTALRHSLDRALDCIDLTVESERAEANSFRRELLRFREVLAGGVYSGSLVKKQELSLLIRELLNLNPVTHSLRLQI